jgi:DNA topoisomerase-2
LPVGTWTDDYKQYIEELIECDNSTKKSSASTPDNKKKKPVSMVKDYTDMSTDTMVDITITFTAGSIKELLAKEGDHGCNGLEKLLKLYTTKSNTNMHAFDENEKLVKYNTINELIEQYLKVRLAFYVKRKAYQVEALKKEAMVLSNKARFITAILEDTLDLRRKKTAVVSALLKEQKYDMIDEDGDFKYLVRLPMDSVTEENVERIIKEKERKISDLETLKGTTETQLWLNELDILKKEYLIQLKNKELEKETASKKQKAKVTKKDAQKVKLVISK